MVSLPIRTASSSSLNRLHRQYRPERLLLHAAHLGPAAGQDRREVEEAALELGVLGVAPTAGAGRRPRPARPRRTPRSWPGARPRSAPRSRSAGRTGRPAGCARPARPARRRTRRGSRPGRPAGRRPSRPVRSAANTAVSARSSAASRSASAKTMFGFLPPSSSATFLTVAAAAAITRLPVDSPPVNETRSTSGLSVSGAPTSGPPPRTRLATPAGSPASASSRDQVDGRGRGQLARLEHERAAGGQRGGDLPGGLQQRVVPRGDQRADADRLVHDPADHVGAAGVDDPPARLPRPRPP